MREKIPSILKVDAEGCDRCIIGIWDLKEEWVTGIASVANYRYQAIYIH